MRDHEEFDGVGTCVGDCGDSIEMHIDLIEGHIGRVAFRYDGCAHTALAAQALARLAAGHPVPEVLALNALDVIESLGEVPEDHEHCAVIAVNALHEAIGNAMRTQREPWKRLYRAR